MWTITWIGLNALTVNTLCASSSNGKSLALIPMRRNEHPSMPSIPTPMSKYESSIKCIFVCSDESKNNRKKALVHLISINGFWLMAIIPCNVGGILLGKHKSLLTSCDRGEPILKRDNHRYWPLSHIWTCNYTFDCVLITNNVWIEVRHSSSSSFLEDRQKW